MKFSIYGLHAIEAILKTQPESIEQLCLLHERHSDRVKNIVGLAEKQSIPVNTISKKEFETLAGKSSVHQGVMAQCKNYAGINEKGLETILDSLARPPLLLVLDAVQDPHNLGAIMRSANAFGVDAVIAPKDRAVGLTPVVHKVACGAASVTPFVRVTNLARTLKHLKDRGVWMVGLDEHTETTLPEVDLTGAIAIILGNEGQGMRKLTKNHCDFVAKINLSGEIKSLNVSVACACGLYEATRQRT